MTKLIIIVALINLISCQSEYQVTDEFGLGRQFDGIGGLSGGGATSKLLASYKEPQRSQILDYLFKPNFGASLQILKVEIGGDDQSTEGTEASHMHEEWDQNYNRGYEWWLMKEAKNRNPDIKLWGLSWAWPHWLGDGQTNQPYNNLTKTAIYTTNWIIGAKQYHNLTIDYIGIWNEKVCNYNYILILRQALNGNELTKNVQIVACDTKFYDFYLMKDNQTILNSIYAFGAHYPGTSTPNVAVQSNKTLWSSEDYSTYNDDTGAGCWARTINQNYVNGYMTSTISWNLIASYYFGLPYQEDGLMTAVQPWGGYYQVKNPIWITAHTTQFTEIGWKYLSHGNGVGRLDNGGSYVTLISPDATQLTLVIETMTHNHSVCIRPPLPAFNVTQQTASFKFGGSFSQLQNLYLWRTQLNFDGTPTVAFEATGLVPVTNGVLTLDLDVDNVYTLTTVNGGYHGDYGDTSLSSSFPLPYEDNFQGYVESQEPNYLTPQIGSWEIVVDDQGQFARQTVVTQPVPWCGVNPYPIAVIGDSTWTDINITATMRMPDINSTDKIFVAVHIDASQWTTCHLYDTKGIFFWINKQLSTYQITSDLTRFNLLDAGLVGHVVQANQWYTLSLAVKDNTLSSSINGVKKSSITLPNKIVKNGFAAIGSSSFGYSDVNYVSLSLPN